MDKNQGQGKKQFFLLNIVAHKYFIKYTIW